MNSRIERHVQRLKEERERRKAKHSPFSYFIREVEDSLSLWQARLDSLLIKLEDKMKLA